MKKKTCEICRAELEDSEVYSSLDHEILCHDCSEEQNDLEDLGAFES